MFRVQINKTFENNNVRIKLLIFVNMYDAFIFDTNLEFMI